MWSSGSKNNSSFKNWCLLNKPTKDIPKLSNTLMLGMFCSQTLHCPLTQKLMVACPLQTAAPYGRWSWPKVKSELTETYNNYIYNEGPQPRSQKCLFLRPQKQAPCRARLPELGLCSQDSMHWAATSAAWDWRPRVAGARMVLAETLIEY